MDYLTFEQYGEWGGSLDEAAFKASYPEAKVTIDYFTMGKLKRDTVVSENVSRACMAIVDVIYNAARYTSLGNGIVSGASNDGVSETYVVLAATEVHNKKMEGIKYSLSLWLEDEKNQAGELLLYRGVPRMSRWFHC